MPLGERFPVFYDNNDGRFYDKSDLIVELIVDLLQYDMLGIKIYSKRYHFGFGGSNPNLDEDEGLRRRTNVMEVTRHQG